MTRSAMPSSVRAAATATRAMRGAAAVGMGASASTVMGCNKFGVLPPPTKPRPAGVWSLRHLPEAGKPAAGWGRVGEGAVVGEYRHTLGPPPLTPPHKGEGNTPSVLRCRTSSASDYPHHA